MKTPEAMTTALLTKNTFRNLIACFMTFVVVTSIIACGGGGKGSSNNQDIAPEKFDSVVARVGPIEAVRVGQTANLSQLNSFATSGQPLSFSWSFSHKPDGSNAVLVNPDSENPTFNADVRGAYMAQLVVTADGISSKRAVQVVVATVAPERATGPFNHQGLSSRCLNCHSDDFIVIPGKSSNHLATSNVCETCHTPLGFEVAANVDHLEVFGNCSQCHNGEIAVGKSEFHQQTNVECDECHNTTGFLELGPDGKFDHSGISRACTGCHNGTVSIGMTPTTADTPPGTHPDTNSECGYCHTTLTFNEPYPDHTGPLVNGPGVNCTDCHGVSAIGFPTGHPDTSAVGDCKVCHSVASFSLDGVFNHRVDPTVLSCDTCHTEPNSIGAIGKVSAVPTHPTTTADCGNCHSAGDSFLPAFGSFDHSMPPISLPTTRCDSCHGVTATGLPTPTATYSHMPIGGTDCRDCHSPGTFITGTYDHVGVTSGCETCHNEIISVGKIASHFPTPAGTFCEDCHYDALATPTIFFADASFDHVGIDVNNCMECHNGNFDTTMNTLYGKPTTHIPTSQDCSVCHTTTPPFSTSAQSGFNHVSITGNCESCHNGNPNYVAVGAIGKNFNSAANGVEHIPSIDTCVTCHSNTSSGGFASSSGFLSSIFHNGLTSGCAGCHVSEFLPLPSNSGAKLIKDSNHLPTGQDCDLCHSVSGFTPSSFAHVGITGNCTSCHDGSASFVAVGALGKTPDHPVTTTDCGVCHNTTDFSEVFDHTGRVDNCVECHGDGTVGAVTKKNPGHVPTTEDCSVCHVPGTFENAIFNHTGITSNCASCHDGVIATGKDAKTNPDHISTNQDCSACHVPTAFSQANFDHQNISNNCAVCHGVSVIGKHNNHVPTNEDCVVCHNTTGFVPATFSHDGIVDNCSSCHDAGFATPKKTNHVETNQDCGVCHNPGSFVPATFDHTGIVNNCSSCHGVTSQGKSGDHLSTNLDCHFCHTTATFVGGSWVHDSSTANNCDTCHVNGGGATAKPGGHIPTTEQCDVCHTTNGWAPTSFSHSPAGNYPGDHRRDPGCNGCHRGSIGAGINSDNYPNRVQYAPFCAGCHAGDFRRKGDHIGGENGTTEQNKDCSGGGRGCHKVGDRDFD